MQIISRSGWGARPAKARSVMRSHSRVFIHHTAGPITQTVRSVQNYHMDSRGWSDIAYSFLVDQQGNIYEGRGWGIAGGHTRGYNFVSHAFCMIANTENIVPTPAALSALSFLIAEATRKYGPQLVQGHREVASTACPGRHLYGKINELISQAAVPSIALSLQRGSKGATVKALQTMLNLTVKAGLVVDGDFGPATQAAVIKYETILKVVIDGVWSSGDQATHDALFAYLVSLNEPRDPILATPPSGDRPTLRRGMSGSAVTNLQKVLVYLGSDIVVDGVFGLQTENVIKGLQAFFKVEGGADGIVGPKTWNLIDFLAAKKQQEEASKEAEAARVAAEQARVEAEQARAKIEEENAAQAQREAIALEVDRLANEQKAQEAADLAAQEAADLAAQAERDRQAAVIEAERLAAEKSELERKEAAAAAATLEAEAARKAADAAEMERREAELADLLERDTAAENEAELERIRKQNEELQGEVESANEQISVLRRILDMLISILKALTNPSQNSS